MQSLLLFFKGFIIGLGKIMPGVSGAVLAISMNVYEPALQMINNLKKEPFKSLCFLIPLLMGILLSIIFFSSIIAFFIGRFPMITMCFFLGLLLGTIPSVFYNKIKVQKRDLFLIVTLIGGLLFVMSFINLPTFTIQSNFSYFWIIFLGAIDALSMIIPGLSGTALFLILGSYPFILQLFSNPFANIFATFSFGIGFLITFFLMAKFLNYCFNYHSKTTWKVIFSLIIFSILEFIMEIPVNWQFSTLLLSLFFFFVGLYLVKYVPDA